MSRWLVLILLAGCAAGQADPSTSRLAAGANAIVVNEMEGSVTMVPEGWSLQGQTAGGPQLCHLAAGTQVECEDDPEGAKVSRRVKILALEGHYKGRIGFVDRGNLRPVTP